MRGDLVQRTAVQWQRIPGRRRPALWAAVLLCTGIVLAQYVPLDPLVWGITVFIGLLGLLSFGRGRPAVLFVILLIVWLGLGAFRFSWDTLLLPADHISRFIDPSCKVEVFGRVVDLPDRRQYATNLVLDIASLTDSDFQFPVSGRVLVRVSDTTRRFSYGDFLRFTARLEYPHESRNPGGFDYRSFLFYRGVYALANIAKNNRIVIYPDPDGADFFNRLVIPLREYILSVFRERLPGAAGTLLAGYLIGETRDMPDSLYEAYRRSGTLHLLAVSGSNVWLVLGMFWLLLRAARLPRAVQTLLLLLILVVFCFVTRNDPSVVRAGVMAALVLIGWLFRRRIDMLNIVGVSIILILLWNPRHLFLAGFQLSYAAVLGILIFAPRLLELFPRLSRRRVGRWAAVLTASSLSATAATAPVLAAHFGVIPTISVVANLIMVPLAGLVTNCAVIIVFLHDAWPWAARHIADATQFIAQVSMWCVYRFQAISAGSIEWSQPGAWGIANYLLVLTLLVAARKVYRIRKPIVFYALIAAGVSTAALAFSRVAAPVEIIFFDAGRQPLLGFKFPDETRRIVGTAGALSPANHHWIVEPFLIHSGWTSSTLIYDTIPGSTESAGVNGQIFADGEYPRLDRLSAEPAHVRFVRRGTPSDVLIADYVRSTDNSVLIVYTSAGDIVKFFGNLIKSPAVDVVALPGRMPTAVDIKAVSALTFNTLLLYGGSPPNKSSAVDMAWGRHFPHCRVLATQSHGGILVKMAGPLEIIPTIQ